MARKPDQRNRAIQRGNFIEATLVCIAEDGYHGTTVRKIADAAGVSAGLVKHYFSGKDELVAESYRHIAESALKHSIFESAKAGSDPEKRLAAFVRAFFFPAESSDRRQMRIWVSFWGLVITDATVAKVQAETYLLYRQELSKLINEVNSAKGIELSEDIVHGIAMGVNAIVDGLWLECCINPEILNPSEATRIALEFIWGRLGMKFLGS